ncbi:MAG: hypothetical protein NC453_14590, partial [Muribaculum sp.]|nr:hypothetical protein [Muribaculum sp.]
MKISLDTTIDELNMIGILSVRAYNAFLRAKITDLRQLMGVKDSDLLNIRNCGRKTASEIIYIKNRYEKMLSKELDEEKIAYLLSHPDQRAIVNIKMSYLPPASKYILNNWIKWRFGRLSVRAKNCVPDYVEVEKIIPIVFSDSEFNYDNIKNCGRRTGEELVEYLCDVKHYITELIKDIDTESSQPVIDRENLIRCKIGNEYPYLLDKEVNEIASFYIKTGSLPMLYIVYRYILRSEDSKVMMLRDYYGFNEKRKSMTMDEIGFKHHLSRERVRQIVHEGLSLPNSFGEYFSSELPSFIGNISFLGDEKIEKIKLDNMLDDGIDSILCELISAVVSGYLIIQFDKDCKKYLVRKSLLGNIKIKSVLHQITRQLELQRTEIYKADILSELTK